MMSASAAYRVDRGRTGNDEDSMTDAEKVVPRQSRTKRCPDPTVATAKQLYAMASKCGEPDCYEQLVKAIGGRRTLNSRIAHIRASSPTGPRADPYMTCEEVNHFENLIVLCLFHAVEIDEHEDDYPVDLLRQWKARQAADGETLGIHANLSATELVQAVRTLVRSAASTEVIELAKAARVLRTITERARLAPAEAWRQRAERIAGMNRATPSIWDAVTGERLKMELSRNEQDQFAQLVVDALRQAVLEIQPAADRVLEAAAGVAAADDFVPAAEAWIKRSVDAVIEASGRWPTNLDVDPDEDLNGALMELDAAVVTFRKLAAGENVDIPTPPEPLKLGDPTDAEKFIDGYVALFETAQRFMRVEHLAFEPELHKALMEAVPTLANVPYSPHFLMAGLTLEQNAAVAASVCRNATDAQFEALIDSVVNLDPEAAAAEHLAALRRVYEAAGRADLIAMIDASNVELGEAILAAMPTPEFWHRNSWNARTAVALTVDTAGESSTMGALRSAVERDELVDPILMAFASVVDRLDSRTREYLTTTRQYRADTPLPEWFPVDYLVGVVRRRPAVAGSTIGDLADEFLGAHGTTG